MPNKREMAVLRNFVAEFSPFSAHYCWNMTWEELWEEVEEIVDHRKES